MASIEVSRQPKKAVKLVNVMLSLGLTIIFAVIPAGLTVASTTLVVEESISGREEVLELKDSVERENVSEVCPAILDLLDEISSELPESIPPSEQWQESRRVLDAWAEDLNAISVEKTDSVRLETIRVSTHNLGMILKFENTWGFSSRGLRDRIELDFTRLQGACS